MFDRPSGLYCLAMLSDATRMYLEGVGVGGICIEGGFPCRVWVCSVVLNSVWCLMRCVGAWRGTGCGDVVSFLLGCMCGASAWTYVFVRTYCMSWRIGVFFFCVELCILLRGRLCTYRYSAMVYL